MQHEDSELKYQEKRFRLVQAVLAGEITKEDAWARMAKIGDDIAEQTLALPVTDDLLFKLQDDEVWADIVAYNNLRERNHN